MSLPCPAVTCIRKSQLLPRAPNVPSAPPTSRCQQDSRLALPSYLHQRHGLSAASNCSMVLNWICKSTYVHHSDYAEHLVRPYNCVQCIPTIPWSSVYSKPCPVHICNIVKMKCCGWGEYRHLSQNWPTNMTSIKTVPTDILTCQVHDKVSTEFNLSLLLLSLVSIALYQKFEWSL